MSEAKKKGGGIKGLNAILSLKPSRFNLYNAFNGELFYCEVIKRANPLIFNGGERGIRTLDGL